MATVVRKITKRFFIITNIVVVILFLLACANAFLHPDKWWFIALLGLAFPFLLLLVFAFVIFWLSFRSRWVFLSLAALLIGFTNIKALIGFHFGQAFKMKKENDAIRILSWNVAWFDEQKKEGKPQRSKRKEMLQFIAEQEADILCFQEYLESNISGDYFNNKDEITKMGYPYSYWVGDYILRKGTYTAGAAIFSRYPIVQAYRIQYEGPRTMRAAESLLAADLEVNGKRIRVFTTHLQSLLLKKDDYRNMEIIKSANDSLMEASRSLLRKLKTGYSFRGDQSDLVRQQLDTSPYPEVICGDFNDVPNSYTYFHIRGNRKDVFIEKGTGIGRTFSRLSATLRIDYILADQQFEVLQYKKANVSYSDHFPQVVDLRLK